MEDQYANGQYSDEGIIDAAIELTGTGKFNIKLMLLCGLILLNSALCTNNISFIFPAAACDFQLTSIDNGILITVFMLGMIIGSYFWGCLGNLIGRKHALLIALTTQAVFEASTSVVSNYWGYLFLKACSGFSTNGQLVVLIPYYGEFQAGKHRSRNLCIMETAWTIGMITLPLVAWAIIPLKISYDSEYFFFHSWSLFVLVCSIPAPLLAMWLSTQYETPKYLLEFGTIPELARTLNTMHYENTGELFDKYLEKLKNRGLIELYNEFVLMDNIREKHIISKYDQAREMAHELFNQTLALFKSPFVKSTLLTCGIMFFLGSAYFSMNLWFPELFRRFAMFEEKAKGQPSSVCDVTEKKYAENETDVVVECPPEIPTNVYLHTLILALACLPLNFLLPMTVGKVGLKFFLVTSSAVASCVTVGLFFVQSSTENLILSAIFESCVGMGFTIILSMTVELYPTSLRVIASTFGLLMMRVGAIAGNLMMGHLIDHHCVVLISVIICQLLLCAILGFFIPLKKAKD